jgi:hypothetical protein
LVAVEALKAAWRDVAKIAGAAEAQDAPPCASAR